MEDELFEVILKYGQKELPFLELQEKIEQVSKRKISAFIVEEYWGYVEIEDLIKDLLNQNILDWEQFEIEKQVEVAIKKYEKEEIDLEEAQKRIEKITGTKISQYTLDNYWRAENFEDFVRWVSTKELENWEQIDDEQALSLISEILKNTSDSSILKRNGNALEKRYAKSEGTVSDLIFHEDWA